MKSVCADSVAERSPGAHVWVRPTPLCAQMRRWSRCECHSSGAGMSCCRRQARAKLRKTTQRTQRVQRDTENSKSKKSNPESMSSQDGSPRCRITLCISFPSVSSVAELALLTQVTPPRRARRAGGAQPRRRRVRRSLRFRQAAACRAGWRRPRAATGG